jgi:hypothetical protein
MAPEHQCSRQLEPLTAVDCSSAIHLSVSTMYRDRFTVLYVRVYLFSLYIYLVAALNASAHVR